MTKKAEKKIRQDAILQALLTGTFDKDKLAAQFNVIERTIRRDLNEIADNLGPFNERLHILREKALDTLGPRIEQMSDKNLIKLIATGVTQKLETKIDAVVTSPRPMPWEDIPEVKQALEKIREKMRSENSVKENVTEDT